ncbi:hypothetical protein AB0L40_03400 [Patulibacter sp. NPDC049589]|uniref:hypothetical protein n=1 Tax=Patulibacter sp. NPDC049589 TaxID=3154731 RepID=UPI0034285038
MASLRTLAVAIGNNNCVYMITSSGNLRGRRTVLLAITAATATAGGLATATTAIGEQAPSRSSTANAAADRFEAFTRPQRPDDVFTSASPAAENQRAAAEIATTSRRVFNDASGEAFAFQNGDREVCILWRPSGRSVAGSSCGEVGATIPPGVLVGNANDAPHPVVAGLVPSDVDSVDVVGATGARTTIPVRDGAYVYRGTAPYTLTWASDDGATFRREVRPTAVPTQRAER